MPLFNIKMKDKSERNLKIKFKVREHDFYKTKPKIIVDLPCHSI